jgi:hypothetical protein
MRQIRAREIRTIAVQVCGKNPNLRLKNTYRQLKRAYTRHVELGNDLR